MFKNRTSPSPSLTVWSRVIGRGAGEREGERARERDRGREKSDASTGCVTDSDVTASTELALVLSEGKTRKPARNMAECSYARCALERRTIRKSLQSWTKTMVHIVGE